MYDNFNFFCFQIIFLSAKVMQNINFETNIFFFTFFAHTKLPCLSIVAQPIVSFELCYCSENSGMSIKRVISPK